MYINQCYLTQKVVNVIGEVQQKFGRAQRGELSGIASFDLRFEGFCQIGEWDTELQTTESSVENRV